MIDIIPPELEAALRRHPRAAELFSALPPSHRQQYMRWVADAKDPDTRLSRAQKTVEMIEASTLMSRD